MLRTIIKQRMLIVSVLVLALTFSFGASQARAAEPNIDKYAKCGVNFTKDCETTTTADEDAKLESGTKKLNNTIANIINIFSLIVGTVSVIMIIYGGFRYVTAGGDSGNIGNAKNTILYAIVGLVIVAISQAIVQFALGEVAP